MQSQFTNLTDDELEENNLYKCGVCGKNEPRDADEETSCERKAHVAYLLRLYPNWEGYNGTY